MKKFLSIVLAILMVVTMIPLSVLPAWAAAAADLTVTIDTGASVTLKDADGDGYYDIGTANDLYAFAAAVNGGNSEINGELTADITVNKNVLTVNGALNGNGSNFRVWTPIGGNSYTYNGTFDGGEHTVSGLYFNNSTVNSVGMFGNIYNGGKVMNIGVIDSYICGSGYVGGLAGSVNDGTVENSYNTGTVTGRTDVGGMVGELDGTITNSYNAGTVTGTSSNVGGVVGSNGYYFGTITNCYNAGSVSSTGSYVGGVVGNNYNTVTNSYNTGSVSGSAHVGGVVGSNNYNAKNVSNCYNIGTVTGTDNFVGAVAGGNFSTVTNCYYLKGCATGANNVKQFGIGNGNAGSTTADVAGTTAGKNSLDFGNGSVCELVGYHSIDENCVCTNCGVVEHNNFDIKGFCTECDAYEPAELNENGYYEIGNAGQLFWFANYINTVDRTANAVLTADIDLEGRLWTPIGSTGENNNNFRGVFDGQNHTIEGLYVEGGRAGLGFFGEVRTGTVKNFTIYGEVVANTEVDYIGGVIGSICGLNGENDLARNGAVIQNITSYVNLTAKKHGIGMIGGFVGYANHESLIENCSWYGTFDAGIYRVDSGAGGFIGKIQENTSEVTIRNCGAYGTIKTNYAGDYNNTATIYMGGFLSFTNTNAKTTLENCLFAGKFERGANLTDEAFLGAFGTVRSVNAIVNCYYLGDDGLEAVHSDSNLKPGSDNVEIKKVTAKQLKSGEVAYKLQGTQNDHFWGQTIGTDNYPVLGGEKVYHGYTSCADEVMVYSNDSSVSAANPVHVWGEGVLTRPTKTQEGYYTYTCTACGEATKTEEVERAANYADYTKALEDLRAYLDSDMLTDENKRSISEWLATYDTDEAYGFIAGEEATVQEYIDATAQYVTDIKTCIQDCLAGNHSGNGDYCEICGAELHVCDFTGEWKYDADKHWKECSCGLTSEEGTHTGGTATCTTQAVCESCGAFYGEVAADAHDWSNKDGICANGCGAECTHENQTGSVCEICGAELHVCDFTGEWKYNADKHWKECSCGLISEEGTHTGGTATCTTQAVCETCNTSYGGLLAHDWSDDDGICVNCGISSVLAEIMMLDNGNDGWDSGALLIKDGSGTEIGTATLEDGYDGTYTFRIAENEAFTLTWQDSENSVECRFNVYLNSKLAFVSRVCGYYADGEVVYTYCIHTIEDGVCTKCGQPCRHLNSADGECIDCGFKGMLVEIKMHDYDEDGWMGNNLLIKDSSGTAIGSATFIGGSEGTYAFLIAEKEAFTLTWQDVMFSNYCAFDVAVDGATVFISETCNNYANGEVVYTYCDHTFENSVCTKCGQACEHLNVADGECSDCGLSGMLVEIRMHDKYYDGWTGNALLIQDGSGTTIGTATFTMGSEKTDTFLIAENEVIMLIWQKGDFPEECTFDVAVDGVTVFKSKTGDKYANDEVVYTYCIHTIEDGVCTKCGQPCRHLNSADGECIDCGFKGMLVEIKMHDYDEDGWMGNNLLIKDSSGTAIGSATLIDGSEGTYAFLIAENEAFTLTWQNVMFSNNCTFDVAVDGATVFISETCNNYANGEVVYTYCDHTFENSVCTKCGQACEHPNVADGKCSDCGFKGMLVEISMHDIYGDSWSNNALLIKDGSGTEIGTATLEGGYYDGTYSFLIAENEVFTLIWQKAYFPQECTFDVAVDGVTVFESETGDKYADGEVVYTNCDHTFENSVCTKCGTACAHENQTGNVCEVCGAELHVCDFSGEWKYDADKHWKECTAEYCIKISEEAEHSYVNGKCSCGYACPHDSYTDGVCDNCDYECAHAWGEGALTRPVYDAVLGSKDGYYTYTCTVCGEEKTEVVKSADYAAYEAVSEEINALLQSDELTDAAKQAIYSAANECGLPSNDLTESEQNIVDDLVAELEKIVADAEEKIASGEYVKINGLEEIVKIKDKLNEDLAEKYGEEALAEITDKIGYKYDEKFDELYEKAEALTGSVAENKEALEEIEAEMEAIFAELEKCLAGTHSFTDYEIVRYADCVNNAWEMGSCSVCGETDEREIPDSAYGHKPAWWWETTETEHYKHCINDSCADEIEGTRGQHVYENYEITKAAACGANAEETGTCICGMTHTREVEGTDLTHSFTKYVVTEKAECGKAGKEVAYCDHGCGATDEKEIPALTHKDDNGDYKCDHGCGHEFPKPVEPEQPDDPSEKCDHLCHKDGILGFLWKIISFFCRLFNIQQYCDCGVIHYDAPVFG